VWFFSEAERFGREIVESVYVNVFNIIRFGVVSDLVVIAVVACTSVVLGF